MTLGDRQVIPQQTRLLFKQLISVSNLNILRIIAVEAEKDKSLKQFSRYRCSDIFEIVKFLKASHIAGHIFPCISLKAVKGKTSKNA